MKTDEYNLPNQCLNAVVMPCWGSRISPVWKENILILYDVCQLDCETSDKNCADL